MIILTALFNPGVEGYNTII